MGFATWNEAVAAMRDRADWGRQVNGPILPEESQELVVVGVKKESTKSLSNKWTKTFYRDYLDCIGNFCATVLNIFSKEIISNNTKC